MGLIRNLRFGHATNSSSSHSIVMMKPGRELPDTEFPDDFQDGGRTSFGGDYGFVLADAQSKLLYFAAATSDRYASVEEMRKDFHPWLSDADLELARRTYVYSRQGDDASEFHRDLILMDRVVIVGWHDSDYDNVPEGTVRLPKLGDVGRIRVKKDGEATVFYSPDTGLKARFSGEPYLKSASPELVDVKITDFCPYGCTFCYQGSTKEGAHAPLDLILQTADRLAEIGVFEVALGGGEPMMHPDFPAIVRGFRERGITPNVTSFGVEWLKREEIMEVIGLVGGLGVSIQSPESVRKVEQIAEALRNVPGGDKVQILPQHAVGTGDLGDIVDAVKDTMENPALLLLGFKDVGRGTSGQTHPQDDLDVLVALDTYGYGYGNLQLSVDTAFLDQYPDVIKELKVPEHMTSSPEGMFSMYIDLVARKMGPSSYCAEDAYIPLNLEGILEDFARWQPTPSHPALHEAASSYRAF